MFRWYLVQFFRGICSLIALLFLIIHIVHFSGAVFFSLCVWSGRFAKAHINRRQTLNSKKMKKHQTQKRDCCAYSSIARMNYNIASARAISLLVFDASECALRGCVVLLRVCFFLFLISPHTSHSSTRFHRQRVRVRKRHEMGHTYSFQLRVLNVNVSMASEQRADHFRAKHFSVNLLVRCPNTICIVHLGSGKSRPTYLKWADRFGKILISNLSTMNFWKLTRLLIVKAKDDGSMVENMTLERQSANSYCLAEQVENRFDLHGRSTNNLLRRKVITFSFDAQAKLLSFSKNFVFLLFHKADDIFRCVLLLLSMSNSPNESKQTNFTLFTCIDHRNKHYHWQWESILSTWARFGCCGNSISTPMNPNKIQCQTNAEMTVIIGQKGKTRHSAFVMADEICNFFEIRPTQCKQVTFRSKHRQI